MRSYIIFLLTIFSSLTVLSQENLAIINDADGLTNIRGGQGKEFPIMGTISKDEFFYCKWTTSDWVEVNGLSRQEGQQIKGYIHKSRVQLIETLDLKKKQELFITILTKQKELADKFRKAWKSKDSLGYRRTVRELEFYSDTKYTPILDILSSYFCSTNDKSLLTLFYATLWADKGSANEMPSFALGQCFICNSDSVIEGLKTIQNKEELKLIMDHIEWGLLNHFNVEENGKSDNKEFNKLKLRLDNERKKASP